MNLNYLTFNDNLSEKTEFLLWGKKVFSVLHKLIDRDGSIKVVKKQTAFRKFALDAETETRRILRLSAPNQAQKR